MSQHTRDTQDPPETGPARPGRPGGGRPGGGRRGGGRRGVVELVVGTGLGQGVLIACSPLLSRLYTPADFALLQVFTGVVSIGAVLASLRLELAIPLPETDHRARALLRAGLVGAGAVGIVLFVAGLATSSWWARGPTLTELARQWWLVPLTVVVLATFQLVSAVLVRLEHYRDLAMRGGVQGVGTATAQVGFGLADVRPLGLLLGLGLGRAAGLVSVLGGRTRLADTGPVTRADMTAALRRYRRFPLVTTWAALANNGGQYAPYLLFSVTYGANPTGWLAFTARLLAMPVTVLGQAVAQVYLGRGAAATRTASGELPRLTGLAVRRLALVGLLPAIALAVLAPPVFGFVFGPTWERAGVYAQLLAPAFLAQFVASPITHVFNLLERQGVALTLDLARLVLVVAVPWTVWSFGGSDVWAVGSYAAVLLLSYGAVLVAARWVLRRG